MLFKGIYKDSGRSQDPIGPRIVGDLAQDRETITLAKAWPSVSHTTSKAAQEPDGGRSLLCSPLRPSRKKSQGCNPYPDFQRVALRSHGRRTPTSSSNRPTC